MKWQRTARLVVAVIGIAAALAVATTMKSRTTPPSAPIVPRTDPAAVVESEGGSTVRIRGERRDGVLAYERLLTYANGTSKMMGVTITSERDGKTFKVTGAEGQAGENESSIELSGGVHMESTDGMTVDAERASFSRSENIVRVPGAVTFSRGRMSGRGIGLDFDQGQNVMRIAAEAAVDVKADAKGGGAMSLSSGTLELRRGERTLRLDRGARIVREGQTIEADLAVAHLTADEQGVELLELRNNSRITAAPSAAGGLQALTGRDIDLRYAPDGQTLQQAVVNGDAVVQLRGERQQPGRQISAAAINVTVGADGTTPIGLVARDAVKVTLPGDRGGATRTINAQALDGTGDETRGITGAHFTGEIQFAEKGAGIDRAARSNVLDVTTSPNFGAIQDATFTKAVRFAEGTLFATAASGRYALERGVLELTGSEPGSLRPHVMDERMSVDATRIDVTLDGPQMKATGAVKSVLNPGKEGKAGDDKARVPSMLKGDQPVNVTADQLSYDGKAGRAVYTGNALLWQGDTSIKGTGITIDRESGDLSASGPVTTSAVLLQDDGKGGKEKVSSVGTADDFAYLDAQRRATYTGDAHITGPQGDLTSPKVELFLKPSGDEVERAEAYESVTLRGDGRKTTGERLTYFAADQRYVVTGTPVTIVDACGRETTGRTLTFFRATDRIVVDGNEQIRTQTRGKSDCK
jgi:lipopolysaccharide transport protein LptA